MKKAFQRKCMSCNAKENKYKLIRVVKTKDNKVQVDITGKIDGRGAYICNNIECLNKAIKTGRIFRVLKTDVDQKIYEDIRGVILDKESK